MMKGELLSRVASSRRYVGLRDSWGGFAPTAPASFACRTLPPQIKSVSLAPWPGSQRCCPPSLGRACAAGYSNLP